MNQKPYIIEKVYVETPVDTDGDGKKDLIAVYLRLPKEVEEGKKVPAIYVANPYMLTCNEDWYVPYNVDCELFRHRISKKKISASIMRLMRKKLHPLYLRSARRWDA